MLNAVGWLTSKLGLKSHELIFVVMLILGLLTAVYYFNNYVDNEVDKVVAENAVEASRLIDDYERERKVVNTDAVADFLKARDEYVSRQNTVVNTTFSTILEQSTSEEEVETTHLEEMASPDTKETDDEPIIANTGQSTPVTPTLNTDQLDTLTDGLWDNYCLAVTGDSTDCEGRSTDRSP